MKSLCAECKYLTLDWKCMAEVLCSNKFPNLHTNQSKIVCLCGSTKFKEAFENATKYESLKGHIVLSVAMFGHHEQLDMEGDEKKLFDALHLRKIQLCNEVLVLNIGGYIGESTSNEIKYAKSIGKLIRYLETPLAHIDNLT